MRMKDPRGGARAGSGRKPLNMSERNLADLEKSFRKVAKENGTSAGQELARLAFTSDNERIRLKALEIYYNVAVTKRTEQTINDKRTGPTIGLPPVIAKPPEKLEEKEHVLHG